MSEKTELVELCGLWLNESKAGNKYMAGTMGGARVLVFRNEDKEPDSNAPDYRVFVTSRRRSKKGTGGGGGGRTDPFNDDDLPF